MKTAFITLLTAALIPLSYGATVLTLNSGELQAAGGSYDLTEGIGDNGYGNLSVTMALDAEAFQRDILAGNVKGNIFTANNKIGLGINFSTAEGTAGIYGSWDGGDYTRPISTIGEQTNLSTGLKELFAGKTYTSAAITYQITENGAVTHLTLVDSTGLTITITGQETGLKTQSFGALTSFTYGTDYVTHLVVDGSILDAEGSIAANLAAIAAASVPEPATASLSLLGLAALMMRRRRA